MNWILDLPELTSIRLGNYVFYEKKEDFVVEMKRFVVKWKWWIELPKLTSLVAPNYSFYNTRSATFEGKSKWIELIFRHSKSNTNWIRQECFCQSKDHKKEYLSQIVHNYVDVSKELKKILGKSWVHLFWFVHVCFCKSSKSLIMDYFLTIFEGISNDLSVLSIVLGILVLVIFLYYYISTSFSKHTSSVSSIFLSP